MIPVHQVVFAQKILFLMVAVVFVQLSALAIRMAHIINQVTAGEMDAIYVIAGIIKSAACQNLVPSLETALHLHSKLSLRTAVKHASLFVQTR